MKNEIQQLISELEERSKSHDDVIRACMLFDTDRIYTAMKVECDFVIQKLKLLLKDESKQPQPPDFANTVLGEVPPVVNDGTEEHLKAVEGATPVVRQNEQTKEGLPRKECNDCGNFWYGNERCPECFSMG